MIHPTAIVESSGDISDDVHIGPYAIVTGDITIAPGCRIDAHAQLLNQVALGKNCSIGAGAILGGNPQDLAFDPATASGVVIGDDNVLREYVTIHRSSTPGGATRIGNGNYLMGGCHLGHDASLGEGNILANNCLLGGHVSIGNKTFLGGGSVYHQFIRVGDLAMVQGNAALSMDLPPFLVCHRVNEIVGLNLVGLRRAGLNGDSLSEIKQIFALFFRNGRNVSQALDDAGEVTWSSPEAQAFLEFFRSRGKKGICCRLSRSRQL